jgi:hypothetical protein
LKRAVESFPETGDAAIVKQHLSSGMIHLDAVNVMC